MSLLKLAGGTVYDPANGIAGEIRDLWVENGRIVTAESIAQRTPDRTISLDGYVVMPGGVDMHCHIAGPKVNTARKMLPENKRKSPAVHRTDLLRSGTLGFMPSTFATGYLYAGLVYTTAFDAAIPPLVARHAHEEFADTPVLDKGFFILLGNNHYALKQIAANEHARLKHFMAWLLNATRGYGVKVVNPGGVEVWKQTGGNIHGLDEKVPGFGVTARQIVRELARTADELKLPHPVHLHCNNLGMPGNAATTLATMQACEGHRTHFTHIQFHSYGGTIDEQASMRSAVPELAAYVNSHTNLSVDVGQVMFGDTCSMTGDGPLGHFLHKVTGNKWFSGDTEMEGGCGIVPITYSNKSLVNALQFVIGLEWYLLVNDPWRIGMSTDHPNGASFMAYPQIIALLMSKELRREWIAKLPAGVRERSVLADLDREYTLEEIAIITRASPARILGLKGKGELGPGADADITVYSPQVDRKAMFEFPRYVVKAGEVIVEDGELRAVPYGKTLHVAPAYDTDALPHIQDWFEDHYTMQFSNYPIADHELGELTEIPID